MRFSPHQGERNSILLIIILVICLLFTFSISGSIAKLHKAQTQIAQVQQKVDDLKKDNVEINQQIEAVQQGSYVEQQLRDKLGLAKDGEIVIVMPSPEIVRKFAPDYPEKEPVLPDPILVKWIKLFSNK